MNFNHACFISYRNGTRSDAKSSYRDEHDDDAIDEFARYLALKLVKLLTDRIGPRGCLVFVDGDENCVERGKPLIPTFSKGICNSVTMVVLFTGHYLHPKNLFCAAELEGMLRRLNSRCSCFPEGIEKAPTNWIFTAVMSEPHRVPDILNNNLRFDFSEYKKKGYRVEYDDVTKTMKSGYDDIIVDMATEIANHWDELEYYEEENGVEFNANSDAFLIKNVNVREENEELLSFMKLHRKPFFPNPPRT